MHLMQYYCNKISIMQILDKTTVKFGNLLGIARLNWRDKTGLSQLAGKILSHTQKNYFKVLPSDEYLIT